MIFPIVGAAFDLRRNGRVHPAWLWGILVMTTAFVVIEAITYSGVGQALYRGVTAGSSGAAVSPLEFAAPPAGGLVTGRP